MTVGYVCKYAPVELLSALGAEPARVEPRVVNFNRADAHMHPNICSYAKSVLEDLSLHDYEGLVLTTCCDSIRRLYDTVKELHPELFVFLLDLPRKTGPEAARL